MKHTNIRIPEMQVPLAKEPSDLKVFVKKKNVSVLYDFDFN